MTFTSLLLGCCLAAQSVHADCGFPGRPYRGRFSDNNLNAMLRFPEGFRVSYACEDSNYSLLPIGNRDRVCSEGKWTNQLPTCGECSNTIS